MAEIHDIPLLPPPVLRPVRPRERTGEGRREPRPRPRDDTRPQTDTGTPADDPGHVDEYA